MAILAFAASSSKKSINKQLIQYAAGLIEGRQVEVLEINDYEMPLYSIDREKEGGIPTQAYEFREKIEQADSLLISFAEHNGNYTAAFKSLYDWTSRIDPKVYQNKPAVFLSTSPGGRGGKGVLETAVKSAPHYGAHLKGSLSIPKFFDNFDTEAGKLINQELDQSLKDVLALLG